MPVMAVDEAAALVSFRSLLLGIETGARRRRPPPGRACHRWSREAETLMANYRKGLRRRPRPSRGRADPDDEIIPEVPASPRTRRGDIWILGEHRVGCGDARDLDNALGLTVGCGASRYAVEQRNWLHHRVRRRSHLATVGSRCLCRFSQLRMRRRAIEFASSRVP